MTIESQNQLLNPKDRLALRNERTQDLLNKQPLPDPFSAYVFIDHSTEELITAARGNKESSSISNFFGLFAKESTQESQSMSGPIKCRVYNKDYHSSLINPLDAKTRKDYEEAINSCSEALIRPDHPDLPKLANGSIWQCTRQGQTVQLLTLESDNAFSFTPQSSNSKSGGAKEAMSNGGKVTVGNRPSATRVSVTYADPVSMKDQVAKYPQYKRFLDEFLKRLSATSFSQPSVVVNSMYRSPVDQARAMARSRYTSPDKYDAFLTWCLTEYGTRRKKAREIQQVIRDNKGKSPSEMEAALVTKLKEQQSRGVYLSKHMEHGAFDFQTWKFTISDVNIMLDVLSGMEDSGYVTFYNWEGVWTYNTGNKGDNAAQRKAAGLAKRASGPIANEHIHLNVTTTGSGGE